MSGGNGSAWLRGISQKIALAGVLQPAAQQSSVWNFVSGVTAVWSEANQRWDLTFSGGGGSGHVIQDEGTPLTQRAALNFVGVNVAVTDVAGVTTVTVGAVSLAGSQVTGTLPVARGGTGLGALGTALQAIRVNAGATALEFYTPAAGLTVPGGDGFRFTYSATTTDADPGNGIFRANNATWASVTTLYVDLLEFGATDVTAWLDSLDDFAGSVKGRLRIASISDPTKWVVFNLTGWTTAAGYRKLTVAYVAGPGGILTTAGDAFISFDSGASIVGGTSVTVSAAGVIARAALTGDVTASADSNATTIANDAVDFNKLLNATAADKVIGSDAAGNFKELTLGNGVERSGTTIQISSQLPARGGENVAVDVYPSTQQQGTIATAATVNFDVAIASGKRYKITADVWVDDGAGGVVQFTKSLLVNAHQTGGAAVLATSPVVIDDNAAAGWSFTAAGNGTNVRFALANTSGSTRTYNVAIGFWSMDKP